MSQTYKYKDRLDISIALAEDSLSYFLRNSTAEAMPDMEMSAAFTEAIAALDRFEALLIKEPTADKPVVVKAPRAWDADDTRDLISQLECKQTYVKTRVPAIDKYKAIIDSCVLAGLGRVLVLGKNWEDTVITAADGMNKPLYKNNNGEVGEVRRIVSKNYVLDAQELRMCKCYAKFPWPEALAKSLTETINPIDPRLSLHCSPDSRGYYYISPVLVFTRLEAYTLEMFVYMYVVDFVKEKTQ